MDTAPGIAGVELPSTLSWKGSCPTSLLVVVPLPSMDFFGLLPVLPRGEGNIVPANAVFFLDATKESGGIGDAVSGVEEELGNNDVTLWPFSGPQPPAAGLNIMGSLPAAPGASRWTVGEGASVLSPTAFAGSSVLPRGAS